jgi:predicted deacylase
VSLDVGATKTANTLIGRGVVYLAGPATPIDCEMYGFGGDLNYAFFIADGAPANGAFATALAIGDVVTAKLDYEAA